MNPEIFERLVQLVARRAGLQARAKDHPDWKAAFESRIKACRLSQPRDYLQLLEAQPSAQSGEWRLLLPYLTNGESYFGRDKGQFELLRHRIVPELLEKRRAQRSLRLWSAGCSTGEEPYSLAMLIQELVPPNWNVSILGTDVNEKALQKARRGVYSTWSFRALDAAQRDRYFHSTAGQFEVKPALRDRVRFEIDNLCDASAPSNADLRDMDLILCRNVLIYFGRDAVAHALARFTGALREGGYLLTGHAELHHHDPAPLRVRVFPESVIYQRADAAPTRLSAPAAPLSHPAPPPPIALRRVLSRELEPKPTATPIRAPKTEIAPAISPVEAPNEPSAADWCERAQTEANAGRHAAAIECCQHAIARDGVATAAYLLWAQVAQEQGQHEAAKNLFKKVIYLAPAQVEAYLELGAIYQAEGDASRARRMHLAALDVLRQADAGASHGEKSHGEKSHGEKSHGEKSHGEKSHGEKSHGETAALIAHIEEVLAAARLEQAR